MLNCFAWLYGNMLDNKPFDCITFVVWKLHMYWFYAYIEITRKLNSKLKGDRTVGLTVIPSYTAERLLKSFLISFFQKEKVATVKFWKLVDWNSWRYSERLVNFILYLLNFFLKYQEFIASYYWHLSADNNNDFQVLIFLNRKKYAVH